MTTDELIERKDLFLSIPSLSKVFISIPQWMTWIVMSFLLFRFASGTPTSFLLHHLTPKWEPQTLALSMVPFAATSSEETFKSNNLLHRMTPRPNSSMSIQSGEHARGGDPSPSNNMSISPVPLLPTKRKYVRRASAPPEFMGMTAQQPGGGGVGGGRSLRSILKEGQGGFGDAGWVGHLSLHIYKPLPRGSKLICYMLLFTDLLFFTWLYSNEIQGSYSSIHAGFWIRE